MRKLVTRFTKNEDGAAMVEYGLLVGLIAIVCIGTITIVGTQLDAVFLKVSTALTVVAT